MVIFRIIRNLLRLGIGLLMIPIALMSRSIVGLIILLVLGFVIYGAFTDEKANNRSFKPSPPWKMAIAVSPPT
jgi:protein-S-isoprenylcysteine O-methyltransferase Ste14